MAAADPPAGLLDIASTLPQDEIPFKLRCAICNKLAVNAFRLPCCDQSICESCQCSLSDTCPVCAHTPVSPDLCKPNKALRMTLKVFLRTEEKKREKERQAAAAAAAAAPAVDSPAQIEDDNTAGASEQNGAPEIPSQVEDAPQSEDAVAVAASEQVTEDTPAESQALDDVPNDGTELTQPAAQPETAADEAGPSAPVVEEGKEPNDGQETTDVEATPQDQSQQATENMMNMGAGAAGFAGMNWNGMNPFMSNMPNMFNFQNTMGMPMSMDPMAANQGMFGDYGMNMAGMGMGMGMNYNGQGMYASSGWDGSWQNAQDNFNPNAFANGTGPQHGGAFGGQNMSYPSNSDFQSGYYGSGYGRGGFRGGRGGYHGPGRGGFGNFGPGLPSHGTNSDMPSTVTPNGDPDSTNDGTLNGDGSQVNENGGPDPVSQENATEGDQPPREGEQGPVDQQLQGIPTIDSLDQSTPHNPMGWQGPGYGRGGFRGPAGRGGGYWGAGPMSIPGNYHAPMPPKAPVVEGAPAAPRGMRQGLPNTSMLRQRAFQQGRGSASNSIPLVSQGGNSEPHDQAQTESQGQQPGSRSHSPSQGTASRARSPTANASENDASSRHGRDSKRTINGPEGRAAERPSATQERDINGGRRDEHRSRRSHGRRSRANTRSRSRSPGRNGESRHGSRLPPVIEAKQANGHKEPSETGNPRDLASRVSSRRSSKDRSGRREEVRDRDRERDEDRSRPSRRRDRDRRDRDRESDRDRRRDRERERERERERDRDRDRDRGKGGGGRDRERDRKRSRRDRSESANASDHSSRPQARRTKRETDNDRSRGRNFRPEKPKEKPKEKEREKPQEAEKDPYTLAREAANRERVLREQQNRGVKVNPKSGRRDSRQDRLSGGRRLNYKYEDEL